MKKINLNYFAIGVGLLSVPFFSLFITSLLFILGFKINEFIFPLSILLSIITIFLTTKGNLKEFLFSSLLLITIIIFSLFISSCFYDYSYDGQWYHQEIIYALHNGWNPIYWHHAPNISASTELWVNHYAKGLETISATIYKTTGNIENGKATNFILVIASAFFFYNYLSQFFSFLSSKKQLLLTVVFVLCPIVTNQIFTYYIDWSMYTLLLILVSTLLCLIKQSSIFNYLIIGVIVFLSAAFKFNLLFWSLFVILFYLIYLVFEKKYKNLEKLIWTALIGVSFGVLIAGINPYITNTLDHKNPFYPLMGEGKIDIMLINTPNYLTNKTRTESILVSMFSLPNNSKEERSELPLPSNFSEINYDSAGLCDTRIGGFGFLFSWILVASIILYCLSIGIKNKMKNYFNFTLLLLLCSIFLLPSGWWARYVPFFYVFPLVMLLYSEYIQNKIEFTFFRNLIYITILINLAISFSSAFVKMIDNKTKVDNAIEEISTAKKPSKLNFGENISFKIKLDKQKIKYIVTPIDSLDLHTLSLYVHFSSSQFKVDRIGNIDLLKKL